MTQFPPFYRNVTLQDLFFSLEEASRQGYCVSVGPFKYHAGRAYCVLVALCSCALDSQLSLTELGILLAPLCGAISRPRQGKRLFKIMKAKIAEAGRGVASIDSSGPYP